MKTTSATTNGKANGKAKGKFDFTPTDFDRDHMPPACPAGEWTAKLVKASVGPTKIKPDGSGGYPMVTLEFKMTGTEEEENETFVGSRHRAYLVMPPKGAKGERMMKLNMRNFCQNFDIELDTLPTGKITKVVAVRRLPRRHQGARGNVVDHDPGQQRRGADAALVPRAFRELRRGGVVRRRARRSTRRKRRGGRRGRGGRGGRGHGGFGRGRRGGRRGRRGRRGGGRRRRAGGASGGEGEESYGDAHRGCGGEAQDPVARAKRRKDSATGSAFLSSPREGADARMKASGCQAGR